MTKDGSVRRTRDNPAWYSWCRLGSHDYHVDHWAGPGSAESRSAIASRALARVTTGMRAVEAGTEGMTTMTRFTATFLACPSSLRKRNWLMECWRSRSSGRGRSSKIR